MSGAFSHGVYAEIAPWCARWWNSDVTIALTSGGLTAWQATAIVTQHFSAAMPVPETASEQRHPTEPRQAEPRVFICYSRKDAARVYPHIEFLKADGIDVWFDQGIAAGTIWRREIDAALERATHIVFFVSSASLSSDRCEEEVHYGLDHKTAIVPVFLDDVPLTAGLRVALSRVQALPGYRLSADVLNDALRSAIRGGDAPTSAPVVPETALKPASRPARRIPVVWAGAVFATLIAVASGVALLSGHDDSAPAPVPTAAASIAVLPFVAMSDDESLRHLGEGIAEEFTSQLAGQPYLDVASRTSAFQPHEGKDAVAIAHTLGVTYVLEGSVRPRGDLVRLTTQLIRAADGFHIWSETYDLPGQGSAEQDETIRVASLTVGAQIDLDGQLRDARIETTNDDAFQYFASAARARLQMNTGGSAETWPSILAKVDKAIALDPDFASALLLRANGYANRLGGTVRWDVAAREARRSIDHALAQRPEDALALGQLAFIQMQLELDLTAAQQTLERVRTINPDMIYLNEASAILAMQRGRVRDAMRYWQQAIERNRPNSFPLSMYGYLLYQQGDLPGAERAFDEALRLAPRGRAKIGGITGRILISMQNGDLEKAKAEFEPVWSEYRHTPVGLFGMLPARLGHEQEARALVAELGSDSNADPNSIFWLYYGLKDYELALEWLLRGVDDRDPITIGFIRLPNVFPEIQDLPGFAAVLAHLDSLQRSP